MKKYTSLIRKLVDATAEAEIHGEDVSELLKERCLNDMNMVRRCLMNAVCDPRFKLYADVVGHWKEQATEALGQLAEQLEKMAPLSDEKADAMLDDFLTAWLRMTFRGVWKRDVHKTAFSVSEETPKESIQDAVGFLQQIRDEFSPPQKMVGGAKKENAVDHENKNPNPNPKDVEPNDSEKKEMHGGVGNHPTHSTNLQRLEDRFLHKIPRSLVELAKRIGRMGTEGQYKQGKFMTASKSDIAGITIGNDLSAILPSEVALLAEPLTQTIFYQNYTSRRLQLFASASQSKSPNKHQDGPVIICVDTSSSMMGEPILVAKALAAAVAIVAWRRHRHVVMIKYSDYYDYMDMGSRSSNLGMVSRFLDCVSMAGNNENSMFQGLFRDIKPKLPEYDTADILCISDFGWCILSDETLSLINDEKKNGMRFYGLNVNSQNPVMNTAKTYGLYSSMNVCDSEWVYENGECIEVNK